MSYGNELKLEFGARRVPYPKLPEIEKGEWTLGTRASGWQLGTPDQIIVSSENELIFVKQRLSLLKDCTVNEFHIGFPDLDFVIRFNNNKLCLKISPDIEDDAGLPYWELFTPDSMLLKVGPNSTWSYIRSDIPE